MGATLGRGSGPSLSDCNAGQLGWATGLTADKSKRPTRKFQKIATDRIDPEIGVRPTSKKPDRISPKLRVKNLTRLFLD